MFHSGGNTPPEWFDTSNAPPADGKDSQPRTSARDHRFTSGVITLITRLVKAGSHLAISRSVDFVAAHGFPLGLTRCDRLSSVPAAGAVVAAGSAQDRCQHPVDQMGRIPGAGTVGGQREVAEGAATRLTSGARVEP